MERGQEWEEHVIWRKQSSKNTIAGGSSAGSLCSSCTSRAGAVLSAVVPLALVSSSSVVGHDAVARFLAMKPMTVVRIARRQHQLAFAVMSALFPLAAVFSAILHLQNAFAVEEEFVVKLSVVYRAVGQLDASAAGHWSRARELIALLAVHVEGFKDTVRKEGVEMGEPS